MENALEVTIIGVLGGIATALIALGGVGFFWLASRIDRLVEQNNTSHNELSEKIAQTHSELSEKINQSHNELVAKMEQMKSEIISTLLNHTHPEPGGPPVFTAPPPAVPPAQESEPTPAPTPADN